MNKPKQIKSTRKAPKIVEWIRKTWDDCIFLSVFLYQENKASNKGMEKNVEKHWFSNIIFCVIHVSLDTQNITF